jgi:glycerol uptake facilitator-like aquaporin
VAAWIGAAYWFTASTSFANPAITIARALSNTFSGIAPNSAPAFIASQLIGALVGLMLAKWLQIGTMAISRVN